MAQAIDLRARLRFSTNKDEPPRHRVYLGEGLGLYLDVTDALGEPAAATGVSFALRRPDGVFLTFTGADVSTDVPGSYYIEVVVEQAGSWYVRGGVAGPRPAYDEALLVVAPSFGVAAALPSPLLATEDLWPLVTADGRLITVVRIRPAWTSSVPRAAWRSMSLTRRCEPQSLPPLWPPSTLLLRSSISRRPVTAARCSLSSSSPETSLWRTSP
jgi:hypothetical protein